jgi:hypothetical protein
MDELTTSLLDLHFELDRLGISLTIGGGFGLYLKRTHVASTGERTLFEALPILRVTNDIDLFLRAEVIANPERTAEVASVVRSLGYDAIPGAEYYQWSRTRVVDGSDYRGTVFVPRAFPYLMMKLHAFDDRKDDAAKDLGRHHALDLFTLVGIMTEPEYEDSVRMGRELASTEQVDRSRRIVNQSFSAPTAIGPLRLREHPLFRADFAVAEFIEVLAEIFSHGSGGR